MIGVLASAALTGVANAQGRGGGGGGGGGPRKDDASPPAVPAAPAANGPGIHRNAKGGYEVWLPPAWVVRENGDHFIAQNQRDSVDALIGPLKDHDADLTDEDVVDFIDDELDDLKVVGDSPTKIGGLDARLLDGTGLDGADVVIFKAVAIDPGEGMPVIVALVYGDEELMTQDNVKGAITHIFNSLKPI